MSKHIAVGIDIGTHQVKVVVAEKPNEREGNVPKILGSGFAESKGIRHGVVVNREEAAKSVDAAVKKAERSSGVKIRGAHLAVGGAGLGAIATAGSAVISRADAEITDLDIEKVLEASQNNIPEPFSLNRKIIHRAPIQFKIDGKPVIGNRPVGMKGNKIEVKTLFVTCLEPHLDNLIAAVEDNDIEVLDVVAAPIAASIVTLNKTQKIAGAVLGNIGAETVSIVVFENNAPVSLEIFSIGSTDITNDIALGLKIPLEEADAIKQGAVVGLSYQKRKIDDIISARISDIFELIEGHLKKIGRNGLLPAGIVLTGGGARLPSLVDSAKSALNLPARVGTINFGGNVKDISDSVWAVACGLCLVGLTTEIEPLGSGVSLIEKTKSKMVSWIKQFLP